MEHHLIIKAFRFSSLTYPTPMYLANKPEVTILKTQTLSNIQKIKLLEEIIKVAKDNKVSLVIIIWIIEICNPLPNPDVSS